MLLPKCLNCGARFSPRDVSRQKRFARCSYCQTIHNVAEFFASNGRVAIRLTPEEEIAIANDLFGANTLNYVELLIVVILTGGSVGYVGWVIDTILRRSPHPIWGMSWQLFLCVSIFGAGAVVVGAGFFWWKVLRRGME